MDRERINSTRLLFRSEIIDSVEKSLLIVVDGAPFLSSQPLEDVIVAQLKS